MLLNVKNWQFTTKPSKMIICSAIPNIFHLQTNVSYIPGFPFASHILPFFINDIPKFTVKFQIVPEINDIPTPNFHIAGADPQNDVVWLNYSHKFFKIQLIAKGLKSNFLEVKVSYFYFKYLRNRIEILYPPGAFLANLVMSMFLYRNLTPVHCACVTNDEYAYLITAPAGTGKTLTSLYLLHKCDNMKILSDDIIITDGVQVWGCPLTASVEYDFPPLGIQGLSYWKNRIIDIFPLLLPFLVNDAKPLIMQIPDKVSFKAYTKFIFFIEKGDISYREIDPNEAVQKITIINRLEFTYQRDVLLSAYSYHDNEFNILSLMRKEENILQLLVSNARSFCVKANSPHDFWKLVLDIIEKFD